MHGTGDIHGVLRAHVGMEVRFTAEQEVSSWDSCRSSGTPSCLSNSTPRTSSGARSARQASSFAPASYRKGSGCMCAASRSLRSTR
eukprot:2906678-Pyramimonas_sp.AAC.1